MNDSRNWTDVKTEFPGGFIAMVTADSPEWEKDSVIEFSESHRRGLDCESEPLLNSHLLENPHFRCHVFAAVMNESVVGYAKLIWMRMGFRNYKGQLLGIDRKPLSPDKVGVGPEPKIISIRELKKQVDEGTLELPDEDKDYPHQLKTWLVSGIGVLPEFQKKGLGKALLQTAASCLDTKLEHMGHSTPVQLPGDALLNSLGVPDEKRIYH